ncbi:hypothetical protein F2Q69_00054434 [Brassica cretica]|uniref:Uncharacterized protein n=1 Tax=Brassica cretica TaxID=69181 RepID=A0A8S9MTY6_BRACR|nr:hypothetical protein F2Q69_00054434 [Brassica cretica]
MEACLAYWLLVPKRKRSRKRAETESEACRNRSEACRNRGSKKKQIWKRDGNDESYLEAFKFDIGIVLEYHMEFLETFGCIWSSKEVIRVIFGRALPGATSRSDYMKSLCTTFRSDFPRATARSRSRFHVRRHTVLTPGATSESDVLKSLPMFRATCWSDTPRSLASSRPETPKSSILERPTKVAPSQSDQPERPAQVARVLTG